MRIGIKSITLLSGVLLNFIMSQLSHAQKLSPGPALQSEYEVAFVVPWQAIEKSLSSKSTYSLTLQNFSVNYQGINFDIPNIMSQFNLNGPKINVHQNSTIWSAQNSSIEIRTSGFSIHKVIRKIIHGVQVNVKVDADCRAFTLKQNSANLSAQILWHDRQAHSEIAVEGLKMQWLPNSWQVSPIKCEGPDGFAQFVEGEINSQLQQPEKIATILISPLTEWLNQNIADVYQQYQKANWQYPQIGKKLQIELTHMDVISSRGLLFRGVVHVEHDGVQVNSIKNKSGQISQPKGELDQASSEYYEVPTDLIPEIQDQPTLILSKKSITAILRDLLRGSTFLTDLTQVSSFQSLLKSRFKQLFLWPDLWEYPRHAKFPLTVQIHQEPDLRWVKDQQLYLKTNVESLVQSYRAGTDRDYVKFKSMIHAQMSVDIEQGLLKLQINKKKLKSKVEFDEQYKIDFAPSEYVATQIADDAIMKMSFLNNPELVLPKLKLNDQMVLRANQLLQPNEDYFFIEWGLEIGPGT